MEYCKWSTSVPQELWKRLFISRINGGCEPSTVSMVCLDNYKNLMMHLDNFSVLLVSHEMGKFEDHCFNFKALLATAQRPGAAGGYPLFPCKFLPI